MMRSIIRVAISAGALALLSACGGSDAGTGVRASVTGTYQLSTINQQSLPFTESSSGAVVKVTAGTLGHGLSVGVGLALAAQRHGTGQRCFAVIGDGEMDEGPIWEALLFAAHFKLDNLVVIVDENRFQAMGTTEEVMALGSLHAKFEAFGFDVRR